MHLQRMILAMFQSMQRMEQCDSSFVRYLIRWQAVALSTVKCCESQGYKIGCLGARYLSIQPSHLWGRMYMALQMELGRHEVLIERSVGGWNELTQKVLIGNREK